MREYKSEFRISKSETNPNVQRIQILGSLPFGISDFGIVADSAKAALAATAGSNLGFRLPCRSGYAKAGASDF
jgi:hypothetical protein